jgi:hypothetical protein
MAKNICRSRISENGENKRNGINNAHQRKLASENINRRS